MSKSSSALPHDLDIERHALGCVLRGGADSVGLLPYISSDLFYDPRHVVIMDAAQAVIEREGEVDMVGVLSELTKRGTKVEAGDFNYLCELEAKVITGHQKPLSVIQHLDDFRLQRFAITLRERPMLPTGLQEYERLLEEVQGAMRIRKAPAEHVSEALASALREIDEGHEHEVAIGLASFDRQVGARRGDLILVGARTSVGKTVVGVNFCRGVFERGKGALLHSFEMKASRIVKRLLSHYSGTENYKVQRGRLSAFEKEEIERQVTKLQQKHFWIRHDHGSWTQHLAAYEACVRINPSIELLVVDYLGLIQDIPGDDQRHLQLGRVTRDLKALAERLNILVVGLAQFNRKTTEQDRPTLENFRESGNLEQDCDTAVLLHAPEWKHNKEIGFIGPEKLVLDIAKQRDGNVGDIEVYYDRRYCRIIDFPEETPAPDPFINVPPDDYDGQGSFLEN